MIPWPMPTLRSVYMVCFAAFGLLVLVGAALDGKLLYGAVGSFPFLGIAYLLRPRR